MQKMHLLFSGIVAPITSISELMKIICGYTKDNFYCSFKFLLWGNENEFVCFKNSFNVNLKSCISLHDYTLHLGLFCYA